MGGSRELSAGIKGRSAVNSMSSSVGKLEATEKARKRKRKAIDNCRKNKELIRSLQPKYKDENFTWF